MKSDSYSTVQINSKIIAVPFMWWHSLASMSLTNRGMVVPLVIGVPV